MNYPGSKGANGVWQTIINHIPPHKYYYELFLGTGEIMRRKKGCEYNYGCEINTEVIKKVNWKKYPLISIEKKNALEEIEILIGYGKSDERFVYLDPPYPIESRRSGRLYYNKYEMSYGQRPLALCQ